MFWARIVKELIHNSCLRFWKKYMGSGSILHLTISLGYSFSRSKSLSNFAKCQLSTQGPIVNGKVVVSVAATGSFAQRVHDYVDRAETVADEMRATLPDEISLDLIYDESSYTTTKFNELIKSFSLATFFVLSLRTSHLSDQRTYIRTVNYINSYAVQYSIILV